MDACSFIKEAQRIVIKIGSAILIDEKQNQIRRAWLEKLSYHIAGWYRAGKEVIIVSSGAIALGRRHLNLMEMNLKLEEKQAAASLGQIRLSHAYQEIFETYNIPIAQILLTLSDTEQRRHHLNARSTMMTLLKLKVIPVINENDAVATAEIRFGDNDRLAARVAAMTSANILILLSDIDGLYDRDPKLYKDATLISEVQEITPSIEAMAGEALPGYSSGGMITKLAAAKIATQAGCHMIIANGRLDNPLAALEQGCSCTTFIAQSEPITARKKWISGSLKPMGSIVLDMGAINALRLGKSLLPAGITKIIGSFERGDAVVLLDPNHQEIGRGLVAYSTKDANLIIGCQTQEIEKILGYRGRDEMIHRDNLVLYQGKNNG
ncbi:MAG: glutamate 5-kinase [Alphaproteobacteria bacterium]|nr:glutamate 5-kinase [Alphaproteobacteria bacterium]